MTKKKQILKETGKKVTVGADEFCPTCMEWREFDEEGRCTVCGRLIKKPSNLPQKITSEHDLTDFTVENEDDSQNNEF